MAQAPEDCSLIQCEDHEWRPWYIVCVHVLEGKPPSHIIAPYGEDVGECICLDCHNSKADVSKLRPVCDKCLEEKLLPSINN